MFCSDSRWWIHAGLVVGLTLSAACSDDSMLPAGALTAGTGAGTGTTDMSPASAAGTTATAGTGAQVGTSGTGAAGTTASAGNSGSGGAGTGVAGSAPPAAGSGGAGASGTGGDVTIAGMGGDAAGAGAGTGAGGMAGAAGSGGAAGEPAMPVDEGEGDGSDVITIGDSWMNILTNGGGIEGGLDRLGKRYRHYAVAGTTLINGDIPAQYNRAKAANPKIKTIIMTGGGNDVMFSNGCATKEACTMFSQRIADALDELWTKAAADGVTSTVYIQYSRNAGTAPEDTRPDTAAVPKICTSGKLKCLSISTTDIIARTDLLDGIHPNSAGCDRIAKRTLEEMVKQGVRR
jgi:lysophospholipase L1-like esterase